LPGHGLSDPPGETSVSAYADWISSFIQELGLRHAAPIGCSLGSAVALSLALNPQPWLSGLVLVGSGARLRVLPSVLQGLRENPEAALMNLGEFSLAPTAGRPLRDMIDAKFRAASAGLIHGDLSACDRFDVMGELERISVPTCVIVGEHDRLTPVKYAQYLAKHIPHAEMSVIPDAGHLVMIEQPAAFNKIMGRFLEQIGKESEGSAR
jgi:pimeloyl-ACP methyl ester carboxylesterase